MRTVYFKNGTKKELQQQIVEIIKERIIEGCGKFEIFSNENNKCFLIINISEIVYID